jgi:hypothetical protein
MKNVTTIPTFCDVVKSTVSYGTHVDNRHPNDTVERVGGNQQADLKHRLSLIYNSTSICIVTGESDTYYLHSMQLTGARVLQVT